MQFFTALLSVLALAVSTTATPLHIAERSTGKLLDDVSAPITQPGGGEVYDVGSTQICCWLTDNIPVSAKSETGSLVIGRFDAKSNSDYFDYERPLYSGFLLIAGCVNYVVPNEAAGDYFLVLVRDSDVGDSDNRSAQFTIT